MAEKKVNHAFFSIKSSGCQHHLPLEWVRERERWQTRGTRFPCPSPNSVVVLPPNFVWGPASKTEQTSRAFCFSDEQSSGGAVCMACSSFSVTPKYACSQYIYRISSSLWFSCCCCSPRSVLSVSDDSACSKKMKRKDGGGNCNHWLSDYYYYRAGLVS